MPKLDQVERDSTAFPDMSPEELEAQRQLMLAYQTGGNTNSINESAPMQADPEE